MFANAMSRRSMPHAPLTKLDHLSRDIWKAWGSGQIGDEAQLLAMQLEARRKALRGDLKPVGIPPGRPSIFPPRRPQRAPVRAVAIARRRHLAASGPMPPALASKFTVSELAVLRIVGDEVSGAGGLRLGPSTRSRRGRGRAARMAQSAIREAAATRAPDGPGAPSAGSEEPAQRRPGRLPRVALLAPHRVQKKCPHGQQEKKRRRGLSAAKGSPLRRAPATSGSNRSRSLHCVPRER